MHIPSDPVLRPPSPPARRRRPSSAIRVLEAVVDSVWSEREHAAVRAASDSTQATTELIADPYQPEEETQIEVDIVGAMNAIFARLPRRPSSVTRDSFQRPRPLEAKTEEIDLPQIEELAQELSADGLEWLDQADLIEL